MLSQVAYLTLIFASGVVGIKQKLILAQDLGAIGNLTMWANIHTLATEQRSLMPRACGTNDVTCDSRSNLANSALCGTLINNVKNMAVSGNAICLTKGGNQCCITWGKSAVNGGNAFPGTDLVPAATAIHNDCKTSGGVSGKAGNVLLESTCLTECLSNRPDGCS